MTMEIPRLTITAPISVYNKVAAIKAVRSLTGLGLKEAKDAVEKPGIEQHFTIRLGIVDTDFEHDTRTLRDEGFVVDPTVNTILENLRKLASKALIIGEDELADGILQLVLAEKLRRKNT